jgi:hypothetical protein
VGLTLRTAAKEKLLIYWQKNIINYRYYYCNQSQYSINLTVACITPGQRCHHISIVVMLSESGSSILNKELLNEQTKDSNSCKNAKSFLQC